MAAKAKAKSKRSTAEANTAIDATPQRDDATPRIDYTDADAIAKAGGVSDPLKGGISPKCSRCDVWCESDPGWKLIGGRVVCTRCQGRS